MIYIQSGMALHLSKESTKEEVILFLKENNFEESVIDVFESKLCWASVSSKHA